MVLPSLEYSSQGFSHQVADQWEGFTAWLNIRHAVNATQKFNGCSPTVTSETKDKRKKPKVNKKNQRELLASKATSKIP